MELYFKNRDEWRTWLRDNYSDVRELWLVFYKKHTGRPSIPYDAAVEEALCFGWIDSIIKRLDDDRYVRKFTPRKAVSEWSDLNLRRAEKMKKAGKMTKAGLARLPKNVKPKPPTPSPEPGIPGFIADALKANPQAMEFFEQLAPSYQRNCVQWISSAKKEETRQRRLSEAITLFTRREKLGMK